MHDRIKLCSHSQILILVTVTVCVCGYGTTLAAESNTACQLRGPKPIEKVVSDPKPLSFKVNYVYRAGGKGEPKQIEDGSVLRSGDHYKIQFTPRENSYVYIFQVDGSKTVYQLFPMEHWENVVLNNRNPVKAGITYSLPAVDKSFVLDEQHGAESIYFVAAREDDPNIARLAEQLGDARKQGNNVRNKRVQQDLTRTLRTRGPAKIVADPAAKSNVNWSREETFKLSEQRLDNLCVRCTNTVTFKHQ